MAVVASPSSRNQTPPSSCSFSYPFASYTSANFAPGASPSSPRASPSLWPPSAFFFHLFATVSNIVIREILLGATTRLPRTTLHGYKEAALKAGKQTQDGRDEEITALRVEIQNLKDDAAVAFEQQQEAFDCISCVWISITLNSESNLCTDLEMYLLESKAGAIVCMLLALFFLGTWLAILTLLERRGRLP
ncbi:Ureide permease [Arachis hypogaea]|nr:Ureide permease [Arachis hypogaea]